MKTTAYRKIGIIAAMQVEAETLKAKIVSPEEETVSGILFTSGILCGVPVVLAVCGEGKVNAAVCAQSMILRYGVDLLLNTGVAGNLSDDLAVGDVAIATDTVEHDYDISLLGYAPGMVLGINMIHIPCDENAVALLDEIMTSIGVNHRLGTVASGDQFIGDAEPKERIRSLFGAIACEMEGAAIGHVAALNGVKYCVIRALSDNADGSAPGNFGAFAASAAEISVRVTETFLSRVAKECKTSPASCPKRRGRVEEE
ncbi:MAG: 5'-methylthioadenosine/adenosylhomocysteine nucleosidase [Clostridia bacterium]|nr:5'-methylthioadenosine/adenosylhomocysteine nucleosidase [Clostridia bacterium]